MLEITYKIVGIMAPSIMLASIGVFWKKFGPEYPTSFVTTLVLNVAMPALIFHTLITADVSLKSLQQVGVASVAMHAVFLLVAVTLLKIARKDIRLSIAHVVGNSGNLGLPLCLLAFGPEGLAYAIAFFAVQCVFLFTVGEAIYAGSANLKRMLQVPVVWAVLVAVLFRYLEIPVNSIVLDFSQLLGQVVIPIMLITLGVSVAGMQVANLPSNILWTFIRTTSALIISLAIAELFSLEGVARGVLILETIVPVAVFNYLLAHRHNRDSTEVSGLILVSHIAALFYLPLVLAYIL